MKTASDTLKQEVEERTDGAAQLPHAIEEVVADASDTLVGMIGAAHDVAEARHAETAWSESEEQFRDMAENADDVFWIRDLSAAHLHYINPAYEKIWGRTRGSLYAAPDSWMDAIHPADRAAAEEIQSLTPDRYDHIYRIVRPDGAIRWVRDRAFPVRNASGNLMQLAGIVTDITDVKEAQIELQETTGQLQILSQRLLEAQEVERRHLARELHDEIGQILTATKITLQSIEKAPEAVDFAVQLQGSITSIDSLLQQVRRISLDLRPPLLDDLGVVPALRCYLGQMAKCSGLAIQFLAPDEWECLDAKIETACFRVVQEAITNAVRHARARCVTVELRRCERLHVAVQDDGIGFDVDAALQRARGGDTVGILGMVERASLLGGSIDIQSTPGAGTEIHALFPLETRKF